MELNIIWVPTLVYSWGDIHNRQSDNNLRVFSKGSAQLNKSRWWRTSHSSYNLKLNEIRHTPTLNLPRLQLNSSMKPNTKRTSWLSSYLVKTSQEESKHPQAPRRGTSAMHVWSKDTGILYFNSGQETVLKSDKSIKETDLKDKGTFKFIVRRERSRDRKDKK